MVRYNSDCKSNCKNKLGFPFSLLLRVCMAFGILSSSSAWAKEYNVACIPQDPSYFAAAVGGFVCPKDAVKCKPEPNFIEMSQSDYGSGEHTKVKIPIFSLKIDESTIKTLGAQLTTVAGSKFKCVPN